MSRRRSTNPTREMPFVDHLEELRWHILRSVIYLAVGCCLCWWKYSILYGFFSDPLTNAFHAAKIDDPLTFLHFLDPLFFKCQIVLTGAVVLAMPLLIWETWRFVAPGLYVEERRHIQPLLPFSLLLCVAGITLVYYAVPIAIEFLLQFLPQDQNVHIIQDPQRYYFFFLRMMVGAGIVFQAPLVILILGKLDIVSSRGLLTYWRHAVLVNFAIAAVITPTIDPLNMSILAVPLCGLYFLSVVLVWFVEVKRRRIARRQPPEATEPPALPPPDSSGSPTPSGTPTGDPAAAGEPTVYEYPGDTPLEEREPAAPGAATPSGVVDRSYLGPLAVEAPAAVPAPPQPAAPVDEALFNPDDDEPGAD